MSEKSDKKAYPLRINAAVLAAMQSWADDELRSLNGQMEFILRKALRDAGRLSVKSANSDSAAPPDEPDSGAT